MESAFGVEHTEISKIAVSRRARNQKAAKVQRRAAGHARATADAQAIKDTTKKVASFPKRVANAKVSIADVGRGAGKVVTGAAKLTTKSPAITGTAVLAGGGYGAYRLSQRPDLPKRKRVSQ